MIFKKLSVFFLALFLSLNAADEARHNDGYAGQLKTFDEDLATLGLDKEHSEKADLDNAYRKLALRWHPDKPNGDREKFEKIKQAYDNLTACNAEMDRMWGSFQACACQNSHYIPRYKVYKPSLLSDDQKTMRNYTMGAITLLVIAAHYVKPLQKQAQALCKKMGIFAARKNMTENLKKMGVKRHWLMPRLVGFGTATFLTLYALIGLVEGHSMEIQDQGLASHLLLLALFTLTYDCMTHLFTPVDPLEENDPIDSVI